MMQLDPSSTTFNPCGGAQSSKIDATPSSIASIASAMAQRSTAQAANSKGGATCLLCALQELARTAFPGTANTGCKFFCGGIKRGGRVRVSVQGCLGVLSSGTNTMVNSPYYFGILAIKPMGPSCQFAIFRGWALRYFPKQSLKSDWYKNYYYYKSRQRT